MRKNKLIYFGLVLFLISVLAGGILWYLGDLLMSRTVKTSSPLSHFIWMPITIIFSAILGLVLMGLGVFLKIQDRLLGKIFLTAIFFLAIFLVVQFLALGFFPPPPLLFGSETLNGFCVQSGFGDLACLAGWIEVFSGWAGIIGFLLLIIGLIVKFIKKRGALKHSETNTPSEF